MSLRRSSPTTRIAATLASTLLGLSQPTLSIEIKSIMLAVAVIIAAWLAWQYVPFPQERSPEPPLQSEFASLADLPAVRTLYLDHFGEDNVPSLRKMQQWHKRNNRIFLIVAEIDPLTNARKIVASCKIVPLIKNTILFFRFAGLTGATIEPSHIVKPRGRIHAWYVGDFVSSCKPSANRIFSDVYKFFRDNLQADTPVFARALTEIGLYYLNMFRFEPIEDCPMELGRICCLFSSNLEGFVEDFRAHRPLRTKRIENVFRKKLRQHKKETGLPHDLHDAAHIESHVSVAA